MMTMLMQVDDRQADIGESTGMFGPYGRLTRAQRDVE
jgi:hypothetical protein